MRNLASTITEPTFVGGFTEAGPIDNLYVDGPARDRFSPAQKASSPFGSDHFAVWTELNVSVTDLQPAHEVPQAVSQPSQPTPRSFAPVLANSIKICSFNIQFLGSFKKRDNVGLADLLKDYDIVVVEELIAPPADGRYPNGDSYAADPESKKFFDAMASHGFDYRMSEEDTGSGEEIHNNGTATGWWVVFYKPGRVKEATDLPSGCLADDRSNNPDYERVPYAFPFRSEGNETDFVLIPVHLMPGSSEAERRQHELASIATWVADHESVEKDFIILGDMNLEDAAELISATPAGFLSLNDECRTTNTNQHGPKPYDHVMYRPAVSTEVDHDFDFQVVNLIEEMKSRWLGTDPYPGAPVYNHNLFRQYFSDHNPVVFHLTIPPGDDDCGDEKPR